MKELVSRIEELTRENHDLRKQVKQLSKTNIDALASMTIITQNTELKDLRRQVEELKDGI